MAKIQEQRYTFPSFHELPAIPNTPQGCLWGFYDRDGQVDERGAINLLTPSVILAAKDEIQSGAHIQLDWSLQNLQFPGFGRKKFEQRVIDNTEKLGDCGFDDEIHINTQSGSQWDSLKHYAAQKSRMFYNGLTYEEAKSSTRNGIHRWCENGGIVGRGLLIDMVAFYTQREGTPPDAWTRFAIPVADLDAALQQQGTVPRQGDVLMIRSGFIKRHNEASSSERKAGTCDNSTAIGLAANEETVKWLYKHHFAAHVGDTVAFEAWPPKGEYVLHEWSLVWWGTPIGEMWDLEALAAECERQRRWTFFLTSAPLNVPGGVGSPPGAIAIF